MTSSSVWDFVYDLSPFVVSAWVKTVVNWFLRPVILKELKNVPGGEESNFGDGGFVQVVGRHVHYAEQKILMSLTYLASVFAAFAFGLKTGNPGPAFIGAFVLVVVGATLIGCVISLEASSLDLPLRGRSRGVKTSTALFLGYILIDIIMIILVCIHHAQIFQTAP